MSKLTVIIAIIFSILVSAIFFLAQKNPKEASVFYSLFLQLIYNEDELSFVQTSNKKIFYLNETNRFDCSVSSITNNDVTYQNCLAKYELSEQRKTHLNVVLTNDMRYAESFYPNIEFHKLSSDFLQISSFCWSDLNLSCWAEYASKNLLKKNHFDHFNVYYDLINQYETICIFGNSRLALNAQLMYPHIDKDIEIKFIFISPVINPFGLREFSEIKNNIDSNNLRVSGYLDEFQLDNNDLIIASTSERDERVDEKYLTQLYRNNQSQIVLFVDKGINSHSNFLPQDLVDLVHKNCGLI